MTLPHESEVIKGIAAKYSTQLDAMTALHDAVMAMLTAGSWTIGKKRGLNPIVAETMIGLLTKASKTFRAIQILCERGLHDEALALVRVLAETTIAIVFILQKRSRERTLIYHAHGMAQQIKMLNDWKSTPGLKRKAPKKMVGLGQSAMSGYLKRLPSGTDVKRHWSGKGSLQEAIKSLRGDVMYATLYRHTSAISHAADFGLQFEVDPTNEEFIWEIEPTVKGFEAPSYSARELLWNAANRIEQRLGLGFAATLAPHKLNRTDVQKGTV